MLFHNTINAFQTILNDIKKFVFSSTLIIQLIFISYHIFSIIIGQGIVLVHSLLLAFLVAYLVVFLATHDMRLSRREKKQINLAFKVSKYIIYTASITISIVWLATEAEEITTLTLLPVITLVISILVQLIGDLLAYTFDRYVRMLKQAIIADTVAPIKEGIGKVKDFYDEQKNNIKDAVSATGSIIGKFFSSP